AGAREGGAMIEAGPKQQARPAIGFIGLGLMGHAFTRRLCACGYAVTGYDLVPEKLEAAARHGVRPAASAAEVAQASDLVQVCVMTASDLEQAVFGDQGVAAAASPQKILIDHSTTEVETTRRFAARLGETGMGWIDAPVSGGPPAAAAGTLAIMAGGEAAHLARAASLLADLGRCTHMGPVGSGQVTKMVNQVLVLANYCVLAEALSLAEAGGVDAARIPEALGAGYAGSTMLQRLYPRMLARDFAPAGYAFQALKDLDMVQALAKALTVPTPMTSQAATLFRILNAKGHGRLDGIAVLRLFDREPV
ncbi:MAG TPA: NAD(P)-dependent oxidoreductase, partial [Geminicoccaceae bacterium]|nr:NAD(P)-dependent oxidoreductase [Geminicoccaceae bacterium]